MRHINPYRKMRRRGVCAIIVTTKGELIFQHRSGDAEMYPGYLALFGGGLEEGESPFQGLCRELGEEVGSRVFPVHRLLNAAWHVKLRGRVKERIYDYTFVVVLEPWRLLRLKEGQGIKYVARQKVSEYKFPPHEEQVLPMYLGEQQKLAA